MRLLADIWGVLTPRQRRWVLAAQVLSVLMAFCTVTGIVSIAPFFSVLGNPQLIDAPGPVHWLYARMHFASHRSFVIALGLGFMALVLIANAINIAGAFVMSRLAWWIGADLQSVLFAAYLDRPYLFHARTHSATLYNNVIHETARATNEILQSVFTLITGLVTASFIVICVLLLNPVVAVAMLAALAGGYLLIYVAVRQRLFRAGQQQSQYFVLQTQIVNEALAAIREILLTGVQAVFSARFDRASRTLSRAVAHTQLISQSPRHIMECVAVAGMVGVALLLGGRADGVTPWLGQLTFMGFAAYRLLPTLQQVFVALVRIRGSRAGFARIVPDLRLARTAAAPPAVDGSWRQCPRRDICLNDVTFRYAEGRASAIDGVSLRIAARAVVGLIGANGSGKTTLVDLIAGLLVPASGQLEVDGVIIDDGNRGHWQRQIAYVPQSIGLLDASISDNIAFGVGPGEIDQERLLIAARRARLDDFVRTLPAGYQHLVGERGVALSGGQRQRIGIARALYRDAAVLILDEATNALDGLTEQELIETLGTLRGHCTIVLIAHRLSSLRTCDAIIELAAGRIIGSRSYAELMRDPPGSQRVAAVR
ncbi:MAG TPA: ABC transporter ATP-binding protein [Steroidobacteraceae bacterium]